MPKKNKIEEKKEIKEDIITIDYNDEMQQSYIDYSLSVIMDRALPDVRDGLKPVHRRILWAMKELGLKNNGPFKKSARVVGETMGKYHPHGDCLDGNTRVFMLDGTIKTMKELYDIGKPQWIFSVDEKTNKIVPAVADDFRVGQYATQIYTIKFANGYEISVTGNHPFRLSNGNWVKAEQMHNGMILDFALTGESRGHKDIVSPLNISPRKKEFIHNIVAEAINLPQKNIVHHKDTNPYNNIPENLIGLTRAEHALVHKNYEKGLELGRHAMFDTDGKYTQSIKEKNSKLTKALNVHHPIIVAKHALDVLKERNMKLTYENYESLRGQIYNLTKIETLVENGYIESFDDFVDKYTNDYKFWNVNVSCNHSKAIYKGREYKWAPNNMCLVPVVGTAERSNYMSKLNKREITRSDGKPAAITRSFTNEEYTKFINSRLPIVTEIKITTLTNEIPMYDFTVDEYHNMFLCASDNANLLVVAHNSSIYEAMVHMGQSWCYNHPLVDGHGNFGSVEGDQQAASRYTEARLSKITEELYLADMEKGVVDFRPNFDNSEQEPVVLPVQIPNILISGTEGIAVGMASKMPTHNLGEVIDATMALLDNPKIKTQDLMKFIKGPDFATYGIITNASELPSIYESGMGKIKVRGRVKVEEGERGKTNIIVTEIPYTMIGATDKFMDNIADLVRNKTLPDVTDIKNFSGKDGIRIVIELRKGADVKRNINLLYKKTKLEDTFGYNALLLSPNGTPKQMSLSDILNEFIVFYKETMTKKYEYLFEKESKQKEIKEGLVRAVDCIDTIIEVLRGSKTVANAKECLMSGKTENIKFKTKTCEAMAKKFSFTEIQADAILDMKLQRLVGLEIDVLMNDLKQHIKNLKEYDELLKSNTKMKNKIKSNLITVKEKYEQKRKTEIIDAEEIVIPKEEIKEEMMYVLINKFGYIKTIDESTYERNKENIPNDYKFCVKIMNTDKVIIFTDAAKCHLIKVLDIPTGKYNDKGTAIEQISNFTTEENILYINSIEETKDKKLIFATQKAMVKIVNGSEFDASKKTIDSTKLNQGDALFAVREVNKESNVVIVTKQKLGIRFNIGDVSEFKKTSVGVKGLKADDKDDVMCFELVNPTDKFMFKDVELQADRLKLTKRNSNGTKMRF